MRLKESIGDPEAPSSTDTGVGPFRFMSDVAVQITSDAAWIPLGRGGGHSISRADIDVSPPVVTSATPALGSTGFPVNRPIILVFDEPVRQGVGNIVLRIASTGMVIETFPVATASNVTFDGPSVSIRPTSNLELDSTYTLEIPSGAIVDGSGNVFGGATGYYFSTAKANNTAPVSSGASIHVTENQAYTGQLPFAVDAQGDGVVYANALDPSHGTLTIQPTGEFTFKPTPHIGALDLFKFSVTDPSGASNTYTVNVQIDEVVEEFVGTEGRDVFAGYMGNDVYTLHGGNDQATGGAGNDTIDGGSGIDAATYLLNRSHYVVAHDAQVWTVTDTTGAEGTDTLTHVERLVFPDVSVAIDMDSGAHGGQAAQILRALYGMDTLRHPDFAGYGVVLLDLGMGYTDLVALAVQTESFWRLAGDPVGHSHAAFVKTVYKNVIGVAPSDADLMFFLDLLNSGAMTQASLGLLACQSPLNVGSADLVGLASVGLSYLVPPELA